MRWCGWSSFRSNRRSGTFGSSDVSMSSEGGKAEVVEVSVKVVLEDEVVFAEDDEDAEIEADSSADA